MLKVFENEVLNKGVLWTRILPEFFHTVTRPMCVKITKSTNRKLAFV
jgi:hypothetical protein